MRPLGRAWLDRLLRLYPREYRERFGDGMREMLRQQHSDAKARSRVAALLFLVRTIRDAVLIGVTERFARFHRRTGMGLARQQVRGGLALLPSSIFHDLRYAIRSLSGQPVFTGMTLLALIVGIGLNTSLVSALDAILFRSWDVPNADRVVRLLSLHPRHGYGGLPIASVAYFEEHAGTLGGVFAQRFHTARAGDPADGEPIRVSLVSGSYFDVLDVGVALGRSFTRLEDVAGSAIAVGVISHDFWTTRYTGDPAVIGTTIHIDGVPFTVIGVADASFRGTGSNRPDVWIPLSTMILLRPLDSANMARLTDPEFCCSELYGRLSPGHTHAQAAGELSALYRGFAQGAHQDGIEVAVVGTAVFDHPEEQERFAGIVALSFTVFVSILLLACANVGNMLIARGTARQHEIGVRMAIGAGRGRVVRQLLTECFVLSAIAGAASALLAPLLPHLLMRLRNQPLPEHLSLAGGTVVAVAMGMSAVSLVLFGVAPALRATRVHVAGALKGGRSASGRFPLQGFLITVQVAVSVALLATAGLLIRGLDRAYSLDPGFRTDGITALRVQLPRNRYNPASERAFFDALGSELESGGIRNGMAALVPFGETMNFTDFVVPGASPDLEVATLVHEITAGYLQLLQIPIVAGRSFLPGDRERGAILVNESLARLHWSGRDPIGESVTIGDRPREVIGVVRDVRLHGFDAGRGDPMYFAPLAANSQGVGEPPVVIVSTDVLTRASNVIRRAEQNAIIETVSLTEQADHSLADSRGAARLAALLACVALLLAMSGVYGVVSYSVEQRRHEIGTRIALGARPLAVIALILRRNATPLWIGLFAGLALAAGASVVLRSQLYGLHPLDPAVFTGVITVLGLAGVAASAIPARHAVRVDPLTALRPD